MKTNVILVDDDRDTLEIFEDYLELKGVNVLATGKNGKEAVELYLRHKPEVILLDVMMPEYDGFFALKNIRERDTSAKVVMVTADMTEQTRNRLQLLKASGILYKPYEINTVIETIEKVKEGQSVIATRSKVSKYTPLC